MTRRFLPLAASACLLWSCTGTTSRPPTKDAARPDGRIPTEAGSGRDNKDSADLATASDSSPVAETERIPEPNATPPESAPSRDASSPLEVGVPVDSATSTSDLAACPNALVPGNYSKSMTWGGANRTYLVHVPSRYDGRKPVPLVIDMHGFTENAAQQAGRSGWREKSDEVGFIVVHPNGLGASWNGGSLCCGTSQSTGVDDEGFIKAIVSKTREEACIDAKRVYATGFSNGGAMAHLLACRAADVFAAAAPVSMGNGTSPCKPARPLSVVMFRATSDLLVPYGGGFLIPFPSAKADLEQWKTLDGCTGQPSAAHGLCQTHSGCQGGTEVTLCTINAGHDLYAAAARVGAAVPDVVWETFAAATLP